MFNKVYVILDTSVWDNEEIAQIVGVTPSVNVAKKLFKNHINNIKDIINFDDLEFSLDGISDGFIVNEDDNSFELYSTDSYGEFHSLISIEEVELTLEKTKDNDYVL